MRISLFCFLGAFLIMPLRSEARTCTEILHYEGPLAACRPYHGNGWSDCFTRQVESLRNILMDKEARCDADKALRDSMDHFQDTAKDIVKNDVKSTFRSIILQKNEGPNRFSAVFDRIKSVEKSILNLHLAMFQVIDNNIVDFSRSISTSPADKSFGMTAAQLRTDGIWAVIASPPSSERIAEERKAVTEKNLATAQKEEQDAYDREQDERKQARRERNRQADTNMMLRTLMSGPPGGSSGSSSSRGDRYHEVKHSE